jgi:hypothetical protein
MPVREKRHLLQQEEWYFTFPMLLPKPYIKLSTGQSTQRLQLTVFFISYGYNYWNRIPNKILQFTLLQMPIDLITLYGEKQTFTKNDFKRITKLPICTTKQNEIL